MPDVAAVRGSSKDVFVPSICTLHLFLLSEERTETSLQMGNDMLGAVVAEEDKIEKPKKADLSKFEKSKQLGDFSNENNNGTDKALSVPEI